MPNQTTFQNDPQCLPSFGKVRPHAGGRFYPVSFFDTYGTVRGKGGRSSYGTATFISCSPDPTTLHSSPLAGTTQGLQFDVDKSTHMAHCPHSGEVGVWLVSGAGVEWVNGRVEAWR